ncbi:MAG: hypothetical protein AB1735_02160, partial [Pseudomonadota bacterium]
RAFSSLLSLQIRAIVALWLWFAPKQGQKSIGFICPIKRAPPHWRLSPSRWRSGGRQGFATPSKSMQAQKNQGKYRGS